MNYYFHSGGGGGGHSTNTSGSSSANYRTKDERAPQCSEGEDDSDGDSVGEEVTVAQKGVNNMLSTYQVEFFTNENSLKERLKLYLVTNRRSSLRVQSFNLLLKLVTVILYLIRAIQDSYNPPHGCYPSSSTSDSVFCMCENVSALADTGTLETLDQWCPIVWVDRPFWLWVCQVGLALINFILLILMTSVKYKGNVLQLVFNWQFFLELINTVPFLLTVVYPHYLRFLFVPVFLNLWLAKEILQNMVHDVNRVINRHQSAIGFQVTCLMATVLALFFISMFGIQHLQRIGKRRINMFESLWFVIVSFSTVGYGDISPDIWPSQLFMMVMIIVSLIVVPRQLERLAYKWVDRQRQGGRYSSYRAHKEKHVVVCTSSLQADTIIDFLREFYAHPKLQEYYVVLLSPGDMDPSLYVFLQIPLWQQRVIFIKGSALRDHDLHRCRMQDAEACFILSCRNNKNRDTADEQAILRAWAIKDYAYDVEQYVQLYRPENLFHVKFAGNVVCEDQFKYALLACNCLYPAVSTLVTLLMHTSRGKEGQRQSEDWIKLYGRCSGNEIYHSVLEKSRRFFTDFAGKSFTYASYHAHKRYGVTLVGVRRDYDSNILLNPGRKFILEPTDTLFYMSITKEEHSTLTKKTTDKAASKGRRSGFPGVNDPQPRKKVAHNRGHNGDRFATNVDMDNIGEDKTNHTDPRNGSSTGVLKPPPELKAYKKKMEARIMRQASLSVIQSNKSGPYFNPSANRQLFIGAPPVTPYVSQTFQLCYIYKEKLDLCCLNLRKACRHVRHTRATEYNWSKKCIIAAVHTPNNGLYNFILPLRAHSLPRDSLQPIIIFCSDPIETSFLEVLSFFPMIYWIQGSIKRLDDWLYAGINDAASVVVVNKETNREEKEDEYLSDCNTIVTVQTIFRLFPRANIITELSQASNMRFMQFRPNDRYALDLSKIEKKEKHAGSTMSYMFRIPFAAGNVFSASMLDTLLYQAYVKNYLITFVRLLLRIDTTLGSGHLSTMTITKTGMDYGSLFRECTETDGEIPIGIYRSEKNLKKAESTVCNIVDPVLDCIAIPLGKSVPANSDRDKSEISKLVKFRMRNLNIPEQEYNDTASSSQLGVSFVIINPSHKLPLQVGDMIYIIRPATERESDCVKRTMNGKECYFPVDDEDSTSRDMTLDENEEGEVNSTNSRSDLNSRSARSESSLKDLTASTGGEQNLNDSPAGVEEYQPSGEKLPNDEPLSEDSSGLIQRVKSSGVTWSDTNS